MAVAIRLARGGSKQRPITASWWRTAATPRWPFHREGRHLQPAAGEGFAGAREARRRSHLALAVGRRAQPSDRVLRFLDAAGIKERPARNNPKKAEPGEKAKERVEERAKRAADAEAAAAEAAAAPAEEAVTEEAPAEAAAEEVVAEEAAAEAPVAEETEAPAEEALAEEALPAAEEAAPKLKPCC